MAGPLLVWAEKRELLLELLGGGSELASSIGAPLKAVILAPGPGRASELAEEMATWADEVLLVEDERLSVPDSAVYAGALHQLVGFEGA